METTTQIIINIFQNIMGIFMYLMPFGLFDSVSYFLDIYSNTLFMLILFIISFILGFVFLVYFIEIFNLPIDPNGINSMREKNKDEESRDTPTFLSKTIRFILGQSNVGTYKDTLLIYISAMKFKLIPVLVVALVLYIPIAGGRGYNTVGEYYFDNKDYISYGLISLFKFDEESEENKKIEEELKYKGLDEDEAIDGAYTNRQHIFDSLSEDAIKDKELQAVTKNQANIYKNVYDQKSYEEYISGLEEKKKIKENAIIALEAKKDSTSPSKRELESMLNKIIQFKQEVNQLETDKNLAEEVYNTTINNTDTLSVKEQMGSLKAEKALIESQYTISEDLLNLANSRVTSSELISKYDNIKVELNKVINGTADNVSTNNKFLKHVNTFIKDSTKTASEKKQYVNELLTQVSNASMKALSTDTINKDQIKSENIMLGQQLKEINDKVKGGENASSSESARLKYIIQLNDEKLRNTDWTGREDERQELLLLQYKLVSDNENLSNNFEDTILLFGNRVQYDGVNLMNGLGVIISITTFLFSFIYYAAIILMAGWKNIYILYIAFLTGITKVLTRYIGEEKNVTKFIDAHRASMGKRFTKVKGQEQSVSNADVDPEFAWFEKNKDKQGTYIILMVEVLVRVAIVYWLFNF